MYWLGLDIGTGGSRALLVDEQGIVRAGHTALHEEMQMARPLWAEQHPADWWRAAQDAVKGVLAQAGVNGDAVQGIGLSGQMHGLVLLDKDQHVLRPSLIWCDQRSQAQVDAAHARLTREAFLQATANPLVTGFTLPKLLWVRDQEPEVFARTRHVLLPKDYVRLQLTGELATEVSDASGTGAFDVAHRRWSHRIMDGLQIDRSLWPACYESPEISGRLTAPAAQATGLKIGTPVVGGGGDQAASAVGNGIVELGIVSCTLGTSGVVFAHAETPAFDPAGRIHTFCHAVPGKWHVMGVTQGAGLSLQWFRHTLARGTGYDALTDEAATSPRGAQELFWLPYLMGERTPHMDAHARGGWIGLTNRHTRADLIRAVLEGVTYSQRDGLDIMREIGVPVASVRASGGGARSPFWRQLLADICQTPVVTLASHEGSAFGAALLAMTGTGAFSDVPAACRATIRTVETTDSQPANAAYYDRAFAAYRALYPALHASFEAMHALGEPT